MNQMTKDEVLYAFAVEDETGRDTLLRYLAAYPQFAHDLVDISRELHRSFSDEPLSAAEMQRVDVAIARYQGVMVKQTSESLAPQAFNGAAELMQLPLSVMVAFRERRVDLASVPTRFLERLAGALSTSMEQLSAFLLQPAMVSAARQSKSRVKPTTAVKVSLEKVLSDAGVQADRIQSLIERGE
ncbi:hypothetical protein HZU75_04605 [Chitinibacter fontanus]|uniref:Uncharacterized protein n=1 Tax=Chitinibacter fontanus TaxID=1737446 RepID=A0A7D5ZBD2_9NEIS|nr:hypothetical protein [Chitinibacter fontanus]QLI80866.1 hypothetical protein HZU75_04605 [Chitinibacter fontanus]